MAQVLEETVLIKVSRLVKSSEAKTAPSVTNDMVESLEAVVQELVGSAAVVEVSLVSEE